MRKRAVVTSFIAQRSDNEITKILLFKRSTEVRTYKKVPNKQKFVQSLICYPCDREHWASCSGSIDPADHNPLDRAWIELREETQLTTEELSLLCSGEPQTLTDVGLDTQWTVYPFLFEMKSPEFESRVKFDWEPTEFNWIQPGKLGDYLTVPSLNETLQCVMVGS